MDESYLLDAGFGYDQISIDSTNYNVDMDVNNINTVSARELRLYNKMNKFHPSTHASKTGLDCDDQNPSAYSCAGIQRINRRASTMNNIEDYIREDHPYNKYPRKSRGFSSYPNIMEQKKPQQESFTPTSDMEHLQEEIDKMEEKNNMLVMFIFFLVVIVLVQYAKSTNDGYMIRYLLIPSGVESSKASAAASAAASATETASAAAPAASA